MIDADAEFDSLCRAETRVAVPDRTSPATCGQFPTTVVGPVREVP
jgi:hypothetical protein